MSAIPNYVEQAWRFSEKELDDVEVVVDLRDCLTDADLARASTASSGGRGAPSRADFLPRDDRTPSSASHLSDEIDIDSVLRALASEVTEAEDMFPSLRLQPLDRSGHAEEDQLVFNSNWLGGLSRRSSAISVHSDEMSVAFPCSPAETTSGPGEASEASQSPSQAEADFELQEEILHSVEHDDAVAALLEGRSSPSGSSDSGGMPGGPLADVAEDMISVVDIGDEVQVLSSPAEADSVHALPYMISPRPLESTVASLLRRLSLEHQVDESVASSIRGVLEVSELLAEAEMAGANHLTQEEIEALPSFPYAPCKEQQHCAICLDAFQEREVVTMLRCTHFFHMECLASWMHRATKCPLCRAYCIE